MKGLKMIKWAMVGAWALGAVLLVGGASLWRSSAAGQKPPPAQGPAAAQSAGYVGEDTCMQCHSDQAEHYAKTPHAALKDDSSWKGKVTGCESCHGAGAAHVETMSEAMGDGADPAQVRDKKINDLGEMSAKQVSDTCLTCHAGRDEHNNYRRGEHWRNDVGCADCHTSHSPTAGAYRAGSNVFVSEAKADKPGFAAGKMLRAGEPQLCMQCHSETKHQFNMPFRHKVLEGAMNCSDCHNAHGGFEAKQARLATGADAACVKCHTDKQGPFTYEHAPVKTEGCASCHTPHGSSNPRLLKTNRVAQLCLECHSQSHGVGAATPIGPVHNLNQQYADCTACHTEVHGSHTSPVFMR